MLSFLIFIAILVVLILAHEFGHFIVAKMFGIRVDEFGIFFPPRLLGFKWGETTYTINSLPFGGFVKIYGENGDESEKTVPEENSLTRFDKRSFTQKSRWIQAAVIVAGIIFNIIFAWLIVSAGYMFGMQSSVDHIGVGAVQDAQTTLVNVLPGSPADKVGLKANDIVEEIQTGTAMMPKNSDADQVQAFIAAHQNESMVVSVERSGAPLTFIAKPVDGLVAGHKALGIELDDVGILKLNPALALVQGAIITKEMVVETATGLGSFFYTIARGTADFSSVAGPIGIVRIGADTVNQGYMNTIFLTALISINLALINVIPIPGLDGGRLLFIIIEGLTRKPISEKLASRLTYIGLGLLVLLMLVISYHDILHIVHPV